MSDALIETSMSVKWLKNRSDMLRKTATISFAFELGAILSHCIDK